MKIKIKEIYDYLNFISPFDIQSSWDNSGLLIGNLNDEVTKIYLSLDIDEYLLDKACENSLFIVHHPLIFKGIKHISGNLYPQKLITKMIQKNIALIAMHTNFDLSHLNEYFTEQILGLSVYSKEDFLIYCEVDFTFKDFVFYVKEKLNIEHLRVVQTKNNQLKKVAICTGSGGDLIANVKADCFLSGDFKYHQALESYHNNLNLIDIGHYDSEKYFGEILARHLQKFPLEVIISVSKNPFQYF